MELPLGQLWLPIVVSAVVVFFASFLVWMVLTHHKQDIKTVPDEKALTGHLQQLGLAPGVYMWPGCPEGEDMKSEAYKARYDAGPWGSINILPGKPNFARNLLSVFVFYLLVSMLVGYMTALARGPGLGFLPIFRVATTAAVLAYCAGSIPGAIFFGKPGRFVLTEFLDNLVYAVLTGATFGILWPG